MRRASNYTENLKMYRSTVAFLFQSFYFLYYCYSFCRYVRKAKNDAKFHFMDDADFQQTSVKALDQF